MFNSFASGGQTNRDLFANGANGNNSLLAGSCLVLSGVLERCFVAADLRYVKQPQGYEVYGNRGESPLVCKLRRSLYGIKQGPGIFTRCCTNS